MLNLELHIQPHTEQRLKAILASTPDEETFAQNIIAYQMAELRKGILNIRLDLKQFEAQYRQSSEEFYRQFEQGLADDTEDFMLWAGLYEMLCDNERRLDALT
jgi:hypothetical protein